MGHQIKMCCHVYDRRICPLAAELILSMNFSHGRRDGYIYTYILWLYNVYICIYIVGVVTEVHRRWSIASGMTVNSIDKWTRKCLTRMSMRVNVQGERGKGPQSASVCPNDGRCNANRLSSSGFAAIVCLPSTFADALLEISTSSRNL